LSSSSAGAQGRPDAGTILDTVKPAPSPPRLGPGLDLPPPPRPVFSAQPGLKVQVKGFRILGNSLFSADQLRPLVDPFVGKELNIDGLNEAAAAVKVLKSDGPTDGLSYNSVTHPQWELMKWIVGGSGPRGGDRRREGAGASGRDKCACMF
jgi:hypothetical protein